MRYRYPLAAAGLLAVVLVLLLGLAGPAQSQEWPPISVDMRAARSGDLVTFVMFVTNRSAQTYSYDVRAAIPEGANLVSCQYGTNRADWRQCGLDGLGNLGWTSPGGIKGGTTVGPYTFTVDVSQAPRPVSFAWVNFYNNTPAGAWTGPLVAPADARPASTVYVGTGRGTVAGNAFMPRELTVPAGRSLTFVWTSDEPHTVTFLSSVSPPPDAPPPFWPETVRPGDSVTYDGTQFINTGIQERGNRLTVMFPTTGRFAYFCAIHPGMAGLVNVVAPGGGYTTQAEAWVRAEQENRTLLGLVPAAQQQGLAGYRQTRRPDGTTLWEVQVGSVVRAPSGYLELLQYFPPTVRIRAGDTIRWKAGSPHTVTFLAPGQAPFDPFETPPTKPSQNYDQTRTYHSGVLGLAELLGPDAPSEFDLTFPNPGTFPYVCLLHGPLGHVGTVVVEAR